MRHFDAKMRVIDMDQNIDRFLSLGLSVFRGAFDFGRFINADVEETKN